MSAQAALVACFRVKFAGRIKLTELNHPVKQMYLNFCRTYPGAAAAEDAGGDRIEWRQILSDKVDATVIGNRCQIRILGDAFHRSTHYGPDEI